MSPPDASVRPAPSDERGTGRPVRVALRVRHPRLWHVGLVASLTDAGHRVRVEVTEPAGGWHRDVEALFRREARLHRVPAAGVAPVGVDRLPVGTTPAGGEVRIDLTGDATAPAGPAASAWTVSFDDHGGEDAVVASLLAGRFPVVRVLDPAGRVRAEGRPGSELPGVVSAAASDVLAGTAQLIVAALTGRRLTLPAEPDASGGSSGAAAAGRPGDRRPVTPAAAARRAVVGAAVRRAYRAAYRTPHWRVGWRFVDGPGLLESGRLPAEGWHDLPDDGRHFYADPFPVLTGDRTHVFVEDYDHDLGRGVISVVELDERGPLGAPRPVLEHAVHLSYPVVVADGGEHWMIPESSGAGTVELYRAVDYPDRWRLETVLLRDLDANDATPFRHEGRWWLAATVRRGGSCSDALHLWHAEELTGPWKPHDRNPVLVDIASARPAGLPVHHGGRLLRPVQDGRRGYGAALAVAEVVELDPSAFAQRVVARVGPGGSWPGTRLHTVNRAGRLEVVDGSARSPRLRPGSGRRAPSGV